MKMTIARLTKALLVGAITAALGTAAHAQLLTTSYQVNGFVDWSLSAVGSNDIAVGNLKAIVPTGSTVVKAFLYSSQYSSFPTPVVTLDGTTYSGAAWTPLGINPSNSYLEAWRADVTSQMQTAIGGGNASPFLFSVNEGANNDITDGEVLAIVFSNPTLITTTHTIAFLDGTSSSTGNTTTITYASPLTGVGAGFSEQMSLGIGFSAGGGQYSTVDVNGRRLTTSAGGYDDGGPFDGGLITVGGNGVTIDSTANPDPILVGGDTRNDDELYDLGQGNSVNSSPFVANGDLSTTINTVNPSNDDNIFFLGLNVTAEAQVTNGVPDATGTAVLLLLALGALGLATKCRRVEA
jgi:hypothetical protein